jgi:hypothetical protein
MKRFTILQSNPDIIRFDVTAFPNRSQTPRQIFEIRILSVLANFRDP